MSTVVEHENGLDSGEEDCNEFTVRLEGGGPWGFSLQGGADFRSPLKISRVGSHGKASKSGLNPGHIIVAINGQLTSGLKHLEAQRLIKTTSEETGVLELRCAKHVPTQQITPKTTATFHFPVSHQTPAAGKSSTLGRVRPTSSHNIVTPPPPPTVMRQRSSSDAARSTKKVAGIAIPAPPPCVRQTPSLGSAGSESVSSLSPSPAEKDPPLAHWDDSVEVKCEEVQQEFQPSRDAVYNVTLTEILPAGNEGNVEANGTDEDNVEANGRDEDSVAASQEAALEGKKATAKGVISGWFNSHAAKEQKQDHTPHKQTQQSVVKQEPTISHSDPVKVTPPAQAVVRPSAETPKESTTQQRGHVKTSSGDWYKQMFHSLKESVDAEFPDRKKVWDRSPTPVRKTSYEFKSNTQSDNPSHAAKPATFGQAQRSEWNHSLHGRSASFSEDNPVWDEPAATQPAPVTTPPVHKPPQDRALRQRSTSSSSIGKSEQVDPNMIFRKTTSGSSIVYRKNSASYSISRDYWKQLEKTRERKNTNESFRSSRNSTSRDNARTLSSSSIGSGNASPDLLIESATASKTLQELETTPPNPSPTATTPANPPPTVTSPTTPSSAQEVLHKTEDVVSADHTSESVVQPEASDPVTPTVESNVMAKLHPLLQMDPNEEQREQEPQSEASGDLFSRIDPTKLSSAIGNASAIGAMEQEGASPLVLQSAALMAGKQQEQEPVQPKKTAKPHKPPPAEHAKALHSFVAANDKELSFAKGDILTLTRTVDQNWLEGKLDGKIGIFPVNFVKVLTAEEATAIGQEEPVEEEQPLNIAARAKYDFNATSSRQLTFKKGDVITLLKQLDDNWYRGCLGDEEGILPVTYIELIDNEDQ